MAVRFAPSGELFVGGTDRGWGARGGKRFGLERVNWNGKTPFEICEMKAKPDGFELIFTLPADVETLAKTESYKMNSYDYIYQSGYGSPVVDKQDNVITKAVPSADGKSVRLYIDKMRKGKVHELHVDGIKSATGLPVLHPRAYYTLNEIPSGA